MISDNSKTALIKRKPVFLIFLPLTIIGFGAFAFQLAGDHPERAWLSYLINFLLWSAIAQGGLLFSAVMHLTKARWSGPLSGISESFAAFFPVSFGIFLSLFLGKDHLFPWLHHELSGTKAVWLNLPFLFFRDCFGLLLLYGIGFAYLYYALQFKRDPSRRSQHLECTREKMTLLSVLYILAFTGVLSLIGFDLVMGMEPHWISTLFGAYSFVKAFYIGLGALIILASLLHLSRGSDSRLTPAHFHDLGKLFFAFCLIWADFFYCQLLVIWYGNISEETHYIIQRTMVYPWKSIAWTVFMVCFITPFFVLLNRKVKTRPVMMIVLCSTVIVGIWLEHFLLLGPALMRDVSSLPLTLADGLIFLGFMGLLVLAVSSFLNRFPELIMVKEGEAQ